MDKVYYYERVSEFPIFMNKQYEKQNIPAPKFNQVDSKDIDEFGVKFWEYKNTENETVYAVEIMVVEEISDILISLSRISDKEINKVIEKNKKILNS